MYQHYEILVHHDEVQLQGKGHNSESYIFGVMPLFKCNYTLAYVKGHLLHPYID